MSRPRTADWSSLTADNGRSQEETPPTRDWSSVAEMTPPVIGPLGIDLPMLFIVTANTTQAVNLQQYTTNPLGVIPTYTVAKKTAIGSVPASVEAPCPWLRVACPPQTPAIHLPSQSTTE